MNANFTNKNQTPTQPYYTLAEFEKVNTESTVEEIIWFKMNNQLSDLVISL